MLDDALIKVFISALGWNLCNGLATKLEQFISTVDFKVLRQKNLLYQLEKTFSVCMSISLKIVGINDNYFTICKSYLLLPLQICLKQPLICSKLNPEKEYKGPVFLTISGRCTRSW